jgi:2Fe-2S ferredoxin
MSKVSVVFRLAGGEERHVETDPGVSVLQLAQENGIEMEGACEGNMACSTCHVIVDPVFFGQLPEASEEEEEMLDLAVGLKATSRLGCQIIVTDALDGLVLDVPAEARNMMGF